MTNGSLSVEINRLRNGQAASVADAVAVEEPLEIQVSSATRDGAAAKSVSITMRTPGNDQALALGFLFTEGIIATADQVLAVQHQGEADPETGRQNIVRVELAADVDLDLERLQRHFYTTSSCGVCGKASLEALRVTGQDTLAGCTTRFPRQVLYALPDRVREQQTVFATTGGLHAAAVFNAAGEIVAIMEDVGRHNATDKVIGQLLDTGKIPGHEFGLLVSGRASFELMQKTLVARIPLLAAVGAPSSLAVRLAREFDMSLVGFLRNGSCNIYAGATRID